jgi:ubiquinone/menaquinone biosynthesis C-methylase UbiE
MMQVQEAYHLWADTYDDNRNLTRDLDQQVTASVLAHLRCKTILEFGCGTGKNTTLLATLGDRVQALDFSPGMIAKAKEKVLTENVTFEIADITNRWPVVNQSIDLVVCNLVLEHIENLSFVFAEAARVLNSGGHFFVSELHPFRQYQGVVAHFTRDAQRTEIPAYVHHITDFLDAAATNDFQLWRLQEWWHREDENKPPRLISFLFAKTEGTCG